MTWFFALVIVVLIGLAVVVASGRWGGLPAADHDRPDTVVPTGRLLTGQDIAASRFSVSIRGYRIDEVDTLLDRLAAEADRRDRKIAVLSGRAAGTATDDPQPDVEDATHEEQRERGENAWAPENRAPAAEHTSELTDDHAGEHTDDHTGEHAGEPVHRGPES